MCPEVIKCDMLSRKSQGCGIMWHSPENITTATTLLFYCFHYVSSVGVTNSRLFQQRGRHNFLWRSLGDITYLKYRLIKLEVQVPPWYGPLPKHSVQCCVRNDDHLQRGPQFLYASGSTNRWVHPAVSKMNITRRMQHNIFWRLLKEIVCAFTFILNSYQKSYNFLYKEIRQPLNSKDGERVGEPYFQRNGIAQTSYSKTFYKANL